MITYKLKQKNEFEYQIKKGAKIACKIIKITGGWAACCTTFQTLDQATSYWLSMAINTAESFDCDSNIKLIQA